MTQMIQFEVTGFEMTIENANIQKDKVKKELKNALKDYMERVLFKAKALAPFKTGDLRKSLNVGPISDFEWYLRDGVPYGKHQEFGFTSKGERFVQNPFVTPAFLSTKPTIIKL